MPFSIPSTRYPQLPDHIFKFGNSAFGLTFYAVFIVVGALLALLLASWRAYKDGYPKDFFINLFLVAFPMGIIGGRVWYVIAEWPEFANNPVKIFEIWNGGLAIQGGALFGVAAGVLFIKFRRQGVPLLQAADWAIPAILVAQMVGRWGNFFNAEVHGNIVSTDAYGWLPGFIINQMGYHNIGHAALADGQMYVPLFLIEGLVNVGGYFLLTHGLEVALKKHRVYGDATFGYFVWYGVTRLILEPLRESSYNMDAGGVMQAEIMAYIFIAVGVLLLVLNHVGTRLRAQKKLRYPSWLAGFLDNGV